MGLRSPAPKSLDIRPVQLVQLTTPLSFTLPCRPFSTNAVYTYLSQIAVKRRAFSDEAVQSILDYQPPSLCAALDLSDRPAFQLESTGIRPASEYDMLLPEEGAS